MVVVWSGETDEGCRQEEGRSYKRCSYCQSAISEGACFLNGSKAHIIFRFSFTAGLYTEHVNHVFWNAYLKQLCFAVLLCSWSHCGISQNIILFVYWPELSTLNHFYSSYSQVVMSLVSWFWYMQLKQDLQFTTLALGGTSLLGTYFAYSPEIAARYTAWAFNVSAHLFCVFLFNIGLKWKYYLLQQALA